MRNTQKLVAVLALSGLCFAAGMPSESEPAAKTKKHAAAKKEDKTAEQLRDLKDVVDQQQAALQQMQQQLQKTQQQLQQTQSQLNQAQQQAQDAQAKANAVESSSNMQVQKVQSDLSDVKSALNATNDAQKKTAKAVGDLEHPNSMAYKGVRITPTGFIEATEYFRSRATLSDQATPYGSIPLNNYGGYAVPSSTTTCTAATPCTVTNPGLESGYNSHLTEFGITARDSRMAVRFDADEKNTKLAGYFEMDFFGTSPTANPNQTTSYTPRLRQAWARAKFDNGWSITGGQMWSLITLNRKGNDADNANVWIPNIIEASYSIGYDWGRFGSIRINKAINPSTNFAVELSNPQGLTNATTATSGIAGVATPGNSLLGNSLTANCSLAYSAATFTYTVTCADSPYYSTNLAPDVLAKLSYDNPKFGHFEVKGVGRFFRDRVQPTATAGGYNNTAIGGGIGAGAIIPVVPSKVDFIAQGLWGKGVSRYESSNNIDYVVRTAGTGDKQMQLLKSFSALAGFETRPTPKTQLAALFGAEYYYRDYYAENAARTEFTGYGAPTATNTGCYYETFAQAQAVGSSGSCTANNKFIYNGKLYGYYDMFKGPMGTLRFGAEADYDYRGTWSGSGALATSTDPRFAGRSSLAPKGGDTTIFTTMRYILP